MNGRRRLALCLLGSAGLHLLVLAVPAPVPRFAPAMRTAPVTVRFAGHPVAIASQPEARPPDPAPAPSAPSPLPAADARPLEQAVRLLSPPDFSEVELLPTPVPVRLRYEFHVAADGSLAELVLLQSSPVPSGLMPVIERALRAARFAPAVAGGRPVAGRFEMNIEIHPGSPVHQLVPGSRSAD